MTPRSDLRTFLRTLDTDTLADLLAEHAEHDAGLRSRLEELAGDPSEPQGQAEWSGATQTDPVQLSSVLDTVRRLLDANTAADVAPLSRRAVDRVLAATGSGGGLPPALAEQFGRAVSLYARACAAHPPPPRELAEWLTALVLDGPSGPGVRLADFADALGEEGLAHVRDAVAVIPVDEGGHRADAARRLRLELAETTGDVDTVVALLSERLPRLDVSLRIVRVLRAAGRHSEAIAHAANALGHGKAGSGAGRGPLVEALERVRTEQPPVDTSDVEALLRDNRCDDAWKAAARHEPSDMIPLYREHVERLIDSRNPQLYDRAAGQLRRLRMLYRRAGVPREFTPYLSELVGRHRRKTRLLDELRRARIALPRTAAT
ncbi:hypothetical protein [Saccharomonospora piscinae]|uniref:hypothetical protein n=1 Tax=Saccharomonospora piscinae TaxID=687388 RepID=UPI0004669962|nr:hypothetical protein [Saccharomonospora piscinae]